VKPVDRRNDFEARVPELLFQQQPNVVLVVDDEHAPTGRRRLRDLGALLLLGRQPTHLHSLPGTKMRSHATRGPGWVDVGASQARRYRVVTLDGRGAAGSLLHPRKRGPHDLAARAQAVLAHVRGEAFD